MLTSELTISVISTTIGGGTRELHGGGAFLTKFMEMLPGGNGDLTDGLQLASRRGRNRVFQVEVSTHVTVLGFQRN